MTRQEFNSAGFVLAVFYPVFSDTFSIRLNGTVHEMYWRRGIRKGEQMKQAIWGTIFFSILSFSVGVQAQKSIEDLPTGSLVKTYQTSLSRSYTLGALKLLAGRGIDTNLEIATYQAGASKICATLPLPYVPPKENNPYYWTMTGVQFGGKIAIRNTAGAVVGYKFISLIQCGLFDRSISIPSCTGTKCY